MTDTMMRMSQTDDHPYDELERDGRSYLFRLSRMHDTGEWAWHCAVFWPTGSLDSCLARRAFPTIEEAMRDAQEAYVEGDTLPARAYCSRILCEDEEEHTRAYWSAAR